MQSETVRPYGEAKNLWFRGQSDASWGLSPKIWRNEYSDANEAEMRLEFESVGHPLTQAGTARDKWHWYFLMQQPLRFLLADDPGAGKTIMAGLLIKELLIRGDLHRCLIVCPGNLAEQWQDELYQRFQLPFEILTNDKLESARTGNWFAENSMAICRLDKLSRNEDVQAKLLNTDWNLIVCDEAHKMSATFFGNEVKYTKRYRLGQLVGQLTRHFLLMTATPHNGKEEDFQLFMALLDADRFEGRDRDGVHTVDASDLMRRLSSSLSPSGDSGTIHPLHVSAVPSPGINNPHCTVCLNSAANSEITSDKRVCRPVEDARRSSIVSAARTTPRGSLSPLR
jgi:hypothetical protein